MKYVKGPPQGVVAAKVGSLHTHTRRHVHTQSTRLINNALDFDLNKLYYERSYFIISTVSTRFSLPSSPSHLFTLFPVRFSNDFSSFFIWETC